MILLALGLSVAAFIVVLRLTGAVAIASAAVRTAQEATRSLRSPTLTDDEKEALSRRAAGSLFAGFLKIAVIGAAGFAASFAILWGGAAAGLYDLSAALETGASWPFILGATVLATVGWILAERRTRRLP
jgi:hypothetical protein